MKTNAYLVAGLFTSAGIRAQDNTTSRRQPMTGGARGKKLSSLKEALVKITAENTLGVGFVIAMDGVPYIVTNATVISGHNKPSFTTLSGTELHPEKIELSATRDLARLRVSGAQALELAPAINAGNQVTVLNYLKARKIGRVPDRINKIGKDMIELSSVFDDASRGSPLLCNSQTVAGVATRIVYYKALGSDWSSTDRCFAYRLDEAKWYTPNWKSYNRTYGMILRQADEFREIIYEVAGAWIQSPKQAVERKENLGLELNRWVKQHNDFVSDMRKKVSKGSRENANEKMQHRFLENCNTIVDICVSKAESLDFLCTDKKITPYLKIQFKWRSLELIKFCKYLRTRARDYQDNRWI